VTYPDFADVDLLDQAFERIAQAVVQRRVDFLFGAGMSAESDVPVGAAVACRLLRILFPVTGTDPPSETRIADLAVRTPFEAIAEAVEKSPGKGRPDLTEKLRQIFVDPSYPLSPAHHDLLAIAHWFGSPPVLERIFTTNFDELLEIALGASGKRITELNTREIAGAQRTGLIPILYLHGVLEEGQYEITESDVFRTTFKALHNVFRTALSEADAFVFVGYSMSDPDFRRIYRGYREDIELRRENGKDTYVVSPPADRYEYSLGHRIWKTRGAIWLPFTASEFFSRLKTILETKSTIFIEQSIMRKYGLKTTSEYLDKVKLTSEILNIGRADAIRFLAEARTKAG